MMYKMYRETTLGNKLQETLEYLLSYGQITPRLIVTVLLQFDESMSKALAANVDSKFTFKGKKLISYRYCSNVWTLIMNNVTLKDDESYYMVVKELKIVACMAGKPIRTDSSRKEATK